MGGPNKIPNWTNRTWSALCYKKRCTNSLKMLSLCRHYVLLQDDENWERNLYEKVQLFVYLVNFPFCINFKWEIIAVGDFPPENFNINTAASWIFIKISFCWYSKAVWLNQQSEFCYGNVEKKTALSSGRYFFETSEKTELSILYVLMW